MFLALALTGSADTVSAGAGLCHDIVVVGNQFEENLDALVCKDSFNLCMTGNNLDDHLRHGVVIENTYGSVVSGNMIEECNGIAIILDRDRSSPDPDPNEPRSSSPGILQQIHQRFFHLIGSSRRWLRSFGFNDDLGPFRSQPVQLCHIANHRREFDHLERTVLGGGNPESAEGAGNSIEPIDLGQDSCRCGFQHRTDRSVAVLVHPAQVLHTQSHRGQRVLDLVGDLARHFTPRHDPGNPLLGLLGLANIGGHLLKSGVHR